MPNPIDISQFKNNTIQVDIHYLKEFLDEHDNWENPTKYKVTEKFISEDIEKQLTYSPTVYDIINLRITDIEDDVVLFDGYLDDEDISLFDNLVENDVHYNLNHIIIDDIIVISISKHNITITLDYGYIEITY